MGHLVLLLKVGVEFHVSTVEKRAINDRVSLHTLSQKKIVMNEQ